MRRIFAYSSQVLVMDCIGAIGVLGVGPGRGPCQSQSQTVPKEPSPMSLMGVKERFEALGDENRIGGVLPSTDATALASP